MISDMGSVVSDSSTLIHLAGIGRLDLLKRFFGRITITPAVWREVVEQGEGHIYSLKIELDRLKDPGSFRIEDRLYHRALAAVGE